MAGTRRHSVLCAEERVKAAKSRKEHQLNKVRRDIVAASVSLGVFAVEDAPLVGQCLRLLFVIVSVVHILTFVVARSIARCEPQFSTDRS